MSPIISVTGGKGGTGKSFVATNLAYLISQDTNVLLADVDVEAPNDHILLGINQLENEEPIKIFFPMIDYSKCTICGACAKVCDTGAIIMSSGKPPIVMPRLCSGCKACMYACVYDAIHRGERVIGYTYETPVRIKDSSFTLLTGTIRYGEEHTAPAVKVTKERALERANKNKQLLIVDTGAGTGNSISIALQYSNLIIAVTEPTPLGLHDLKAILEISWAMGYRTWVVVNRYGIGDDSPHKRLIKDYGVEYYHRIPFSKEVVEAYSKGIPITLYKPDSHVSLALEELSNQVKSVIQLVSKG